VDIVKIALKRYCLVRIPSLSSPSLMRPVVSPFDHQLRWEVITLGVGVKPPREGHTTRFSLRWGCQGSEAGAGLSGSSPKVDFRQWGLGSS
jgi:hypothetical protein